MVVQNDDNGVQAVAGGRRQLDAGHLKRAVPDQDQRAEPGLCELRADGRRDPKSHRSVIRGRQELGSAMDEQIRRAKHRVAHVAHNDGVLAKKQVEAFEKFPHREAFVGRRGRPIAKDRRLRRTRQLGQRTPAEPGAGQSAHKILEAHVLEVVVADGQLFTGRVDAAGGVEARGEDA